MYYLSTYLGVPNFGTISFFALFYSLTNYYDTLCSIFQYILFILNFLRFGKMKKSEKSVTLLKSVTLSGITLWGHAL